jgi:hypothetical protein
VRDANRSGLGPVYRYRRPLSGSAASPRAEEAMRRSHDARYGETEKGGPGWDGSLDLDAGNGDVSNNRQPREMRARSTVAATGTRDDAPLGHCPMN